MISHNKVQRNYNKSQLETHQTYDSMSGGCDNDPLFRGISRGGISFNDNFEYWGYKNPINGGSVLPDILKLPSNR